MLLDRYTAAADPTLASDPFPDKDWRDLTFREHFYQARVTKREIDEINQLRFHMKEVIEGWYKMRYATAVKGGTGGYYPLSEFDFDEVDAKSMANLNRDIIHIVERIYDERERFARTTDRSGEPASDQA